MTGLNPKTAYWLELLREARVVQESVADRLVAESNELISIFVSVARRAKAG